MLFRSLVTGFRVFLMSAIEEVTSPPGGPFLGLTVDSPWERVKAGGEEGGRGWDGWMASPAQWT